MSLAAEGSACDKGPEYHADRASEESPSPTLQGNQTPFSNHDPLCVLSDPCDDEMSQHGYCGLSAPRHCIHCPQWMQLPHHCIHCGQWCICERLEKARADERAKGMAEDRWISAREAREYEDAIRADEREKAGQRVEALLAFVKVAVRAQVVRDIYAHAAAAARGES